MVVNAATEMFPAEVTLPVTAFVCETTLTSPVAVMVPSMLCPAHAVSVVPAVAVTADEMSCNVARSIAAEPAVSVLEEICCVTRTTSGPLLVETFEVNWPFAVMVAPPLLTEMPPVMSPPKLVAVAPVTAEIVAAIEPPRVPAATEPVLLVRLFLTPVPALTERLPVAVTVASASCPAEIVAAPVVAVNVPLTFCKAEAVRLPETAYVPSRFCMAKALIDAVSEFPAETDVELPMLPSETNVAPVPAENVPSSEPSAEAVTDPNVLVPVALDITPPEYSETPSRAVAVTVVSAANDEIDAVMGSSLVPPPAATVALLIAPAAHKLALKPALTLTFDADACAETRAVPLPALTFAVVIELPTARTALIPAETLPVKPPRAITDALPLVPETVPPTSPFA